MKLSKLLQWSFALLTGLWAYLLSSGSNSWFVTAWGWLFGVVLVLAAITIAALVIAWFLKMFGVIASLPWALDRKLNGPQS